MIVGDRTRRGKDIQEGIAASSTRCREGSMGSEKKWLLHLSDIHFNKPDRNYYDPYDLDRDLRDQLEADVDRLRKKAPSIDGIVISGDVAFAGKEPEYEAASQWLVKLCKESGCQPDAVWCVPGNHDVDRSVYEGSVLLQTLHADIRRSEPGKLDAALGKTLRDKEAAGVLFRPLDNYNKYFASHFRCVTSPEALSWEYRLMLNDSSFLMLRGLNSAIVSSPNDNNRDGKMVLGTLQATAPSRANEAVVLICHHPPDWMIDYETVLPVLNARARVQLFGHKHHQAVSLVDNSLCVAAGAVQPDRREPAWRPRYSLLSFSVVRLDGKRRLEVEIHPRVWSEVEPKFIPDYNRCEGAESRTYQLLLEPWEPNTPPETEVQGAQQAPLARMQTGDKEMDPAKTLTYRFLSLPHLVRLEIAQELGLLEEQDEGLLDAELLTRMIGRAAAGRKLADLWSRVAAQTGVKPKRPNPYLGR
jgi:predicted MPP superfamily phosphohydrolase